MTNEQLSALTDEELDNLRLRVAVEIEDRRELKDIPTRIAELNKKLSDVRSRRGPKQA